jgi:putative transposase
MPAGRSAIAEVYPALWSHGFAHECLALVVDTSLSDIRIARELDALIARRQRPLMIVSDNGTELTSRAILQW